MFKIVQITKDNCDNKEIKELYESAFPIEERMPYEKFFLPFDSIELDFRAYYDGDTFIGFFIAYIEKLWGRGYGLKIVLDILEKSKTDIPLLGEVESPDQKDAPNLEIRKRRLAFYLRNGVVDTGIHLTHNGVEYTIVTTTKEPIPQEDLDEMVDILKPLNDAFPLIEKWGNLAFPILDYSYLYNIIK